MSRCPKIRVLYWETSSKTQSMELAVFALRHITRHGERLEEDLGAGYGRADVKKHAACELVYRLGEDEEIVVACPPPGGTVAVGHRV